MPFIAEHKVTIIYMCLVIIVCNFAKFLCLQVIIMAQKSQIKIYQKYAIEYIDKLVTALPMDDPLFIAKLSKHRLLPSDTDSHLKALLTQAEKSSYFLDHVIKPALEIGDSSGFDKLLSVMEHCGYDHVEKLACEIKFKIDKASDVGSGMV